MQAVSQPSRVLNAQTGFWNAIGVGLQPLLKLADDTALLGRGQIPAPVLPVPNEPAPPTPTDRVDDILKGLDARKQDWVNTSARQRAQLLRAVLQNVMQLAPKFAKASARYKGAYEAGDGEEMATVLPIVNGLLELCESMQAEGCAPPLSLQERPDGQWVASVWPRNMVPAFFPKFRGEVWLQPGKAPTQGQLYRRKQQQQAQAQQASTAAGAPAGAGSGGVSLVLGAGNQLLVVALDILHVLVVEDKVALVKMNPVNDYAGPLLRQAFAPFVAAGFVEFVYGGADVGKHCTQHALVDSVHLTGSVATYNNIVFGTPKVKVVITDASWPQRQAFLAALSRCLDAMYCRAHWYPGSEQRRAAFKQRFPQAQVLGRAVPEAGQPKGHLKAEPWLLITGLSPEQAQTRDESWGGVLQEVVLTGAAHPGAFLEQAVRYANEQCWGTLAASVFIHPRTQQEHAGAFDAAVAGLRYGSISVNCTATAAFSVTSLPWGAFPGNEPHDVGSGIGFVHNTYLFDHPQKAVMYAPWTYFPQPLWSVGQLGLAAALPWAFKFMSSQRNPLLAVGYLVMVAVHALRHSWRPARVNKQQGSGKRAGRK